MVIDMHVHPGFIAEIAGDPERVAFRRKHFGLYKQHIWPLKLALMQMEAAGIEKAALMPEDLTTGCGDTIVSNEEIRQLVDLAPERFIGFASVDPHRPDAEETLEYAFEQLHLSGLRMNPSTQRFRPNDGIAEPLYELCMRYNRPVVLDMGMSLEPDAPSKYALPVLLEDVLLQYPQLRVCASHFAFPWVAETAALMLRYRNLYADTALLYFDSPKGFFDQVFNRQLGSHWLDRTLRKQVMFASNYPRIEQSRMAEALRSLELRPSTLDLIFGGNAETFLGGEGK